MRIRVSLAAALALVVVVAFGPGGPSAAPSVTTTDNAVVHWSGVAQGAIAAGRPPGSSAVLAGMVHGAMYDAVAGVEGGLEPFATGLTAAPGASADAAVAQAARDVLIARVPGRSLRRHRPVRAAADGAGCVRAGRRDATRGDEASVRTAVHI